MGQHPFSSYRAGERDAIEALHGLIAEANQHARHDHAAVLGRILGTVQFLVDQAQELRGAPGPKSPASVAVREQQATFSCSNPVATERQPAAIGSMRPGMTDPDALTAREQEILGHLARGSANKVIARELSISEATVKVHVKSILRTLGLQNRTQAALYALNRGLGG